MRTRAGVGGDDDDAIGMGREGTSCVIAIDRSVGRFTALLDSELRGV